MKLKIKKCKYYIFFIFFKNVILLKNIVFLFRFYEKQSCSNDYGDKVIYHIFGDIIYRICGKIVHRITNNTIDLVDVESIYRSMYGIDVDPEKLPQQICELLETNEINQQNYIRYLEGIAVDVLTKMRSQRYSENTSNSTHLPSSEMVPQMNMDNVEIINNSYEKNNLNFIKTTGKKIDPVSSLRSNVGRKKFFTIKNRSKRLKAQTKRNRQSDSYKHWHIIDRCYEYGRRYQTNETKKIRKRERCYVRDREQPDHGNSKLYIDRENIADDVNIIDKSDSVIDIDIDKNSETIYENIETIDESIETIDENIEYINESIETIDENIESIDESIETIDENIETIDENIETVDENIETIDETTDTIDENIDETDNNINNIEVRNKNIINNDKNIANVANDIRNTVDEIIEKENFIEKDVVNLNVDTVENSYVENGENFLSSCSSLYETFECFGNHFRSIKPYKRCLSRDEITDPKSCRERDVKLTDSLRQLICLSRIYRNIESRRSTTSSRKLRE